ncbi:hypothetical protein OKW40_003519 [Paraburkholderia sp. RAU6.4a]|uniref:hypothetical protein n=1 Tax=Paraburkholderia sp. RAU6.4a TaxID=2991067 RepID=UPI003D2271A5
MPAPIYVAQEFLIDCPYLRVRSRWDPFRKTKRVCRGPKINDNGPSDGDQTPIHKVGQMKVASRLAIAGEIDVATALLAMEAVA